MNPGHLAIPGSVMFISWQCHVQCHVHQLAVSCSCTISWQCHVQLAVSCSSVGSVMFSVMFISWQCHVHAPSVGSVMFSVMFIIWQCHVHHLAVSCSVGSVMFSVMFISWQCHELHAPSVGSVMFSWQCHVHQLAVSCSVSCTISWQCHVQLAVSCSSIGSVMFMHHQFFSGQHPHSDDGLISGQSSFILTVPSSVPKAAGEPLHSSSCPPVMHPRPPGRHIGIDG